MAKIYPGIVPNKTQQMQMDRKYGMFIHFGINTFNNLEWSDGSLPVESYCPDKIDADSWVKNAKDAGMKYVIIITKHHDGFCLFHTEYTDYGVQSSPNQTDVIMEVSKACKKYGIGLGMYYSLWDRHEKCYKNDEAYVDFMCNQLTELLGGKYGDVCELWLDGSWDKKPEQWNVPKLYELVHKLQPDCAFAVNHTIGSKCRLNIIKRLYFPDRYKQGMPIRYFPSDFRLCDPWFTKRGKDGDPKLYKYDNKTYYLPFEATVCMRTSGHWFWSDKYTDAPPRTPEYIVEKYTHMMEQNNLLVINVAPNVHGEQEESDILPLLKAKMMLGL